mgnify:CR=1 FL=1
MQKEDVIKNYFQSWLDKNIEPLENIFLMTLFIVSAMDRNITDYLKS